MGNEKEIIEELKIFVGKYNHKYSPTKIVYTGYYIYPKLENHPDFKIDPFRSIVHGSTLEEFVANMKNCDLLFVPRKIIIARVTSELLKDKENLWQLSGDEYLDLSKIVDEYNMQFYFDNVL